jgi:plasmid stabilization system protein ParE
VRVEFHVESATELNGATGYYNALQPGLGDALHREVLAAIDRVIAHPHQSVVVERDIRRCLVRRFPYSILFRIASPRLTRILVIRHHRRHPRLGLSRN